MKKTFSFILLVVTLFNLLALTALAESTQDSTIVTVNADGSTTYEHSNGTITVVSAIEKIEVETPQNSQNSSRTSADYKSIVGSVSAINRNKDTDVENWRFKLIGYFDYVEGFSSVCTDARNEITIANDWWHYSNDDNTWNLNEAYGSGRFEYKVLIFTTETVDVDLRIRCDSYGNFY